MISPLIAFIASVLVLFILVIVRVNVAVAVVLSTVVYGVLALSPLGMLLSILRALTNIRTYMVVSIFVMALFMSYELKVGGVLDMLTDSFAALGCRFAGYSIPAVIGLIPMPGGALVSAMTLKEHYFERLGLKPSFASYLNYWFRHVWVSVWPIYQGLIITAAVLGVSVYSVIAATYPITIGAILSGLIVSLPMMARLGNSGCRRSLKLGGILRGVWPFILIAILTIGLKISVAYALLATLVPVLLTLRPSRDRLVEGLKFALNAKIIVIVLAVMIYREFIAESGAAAHLYRLLEQHSVPVLIVSFIIPFMIGVATSGEFVFAGTAFPLMTNILLSDGHINSLPMLVGYMGGFLGVMLSPVHLCLVLTAEHYNSRYRNIYIYIIPAAVLNIALTLVSVYILSQINVFHV